MPHKAVDYSIQFYAEELQEMIASLERHFKVKITADKLKKAIKLYNESRKTAAAKALTACATGKIMPISGEDAWPS